MKLLDLELDVYQGPFDLLFTLILKEEVDVCEVPLAEIILQYVEDLAGGDVVDWEGLSEFLVLISALLELKSRILIPGAGSPDEGLDAETARELLLERLVAYRTFKGAAGWLALRLGEQHGRRRRPPERERRRRALPPEKVAGLHDPLALTVVLRRLLDVRREPDTSHIADVRVDVARQIRAIRRFLHERGRFSFDEAFGDEEPMVQAVSLFALLELIAAGDVRVTQRRVFGDITVQAAEERASA